MEEKTIVIDMGGTFIKYGLIDAKYQITKKNKIATPRDVDKLFESLQAIYHRYANEHVNGIAISVPGLVDIEQGIMKTCGAITCLKDVPLVKKLSALCDNLPVSIENDGKAAALCENWLGSAKDVDSCVVLIFGTGIGGGIIIDNKIVRGNNLFAGEFSGIFIDGDDDSYCNLGSVASTFAIIRTIKEKKKIVDLTGEEMMELYQKNDEDVKKIVDRWFMVIAKTCFNIDLIINPDCICIGGGISENELFITGIKKAIDQVFANTIQFRKPEIRVCKFHNDSNLIGAYYTFKEKYLLKKENKG